MNQSFFLSICGDTVLGAFAPRFKCYFDPSPIIAASAATTQAVANQFAGSSATADSDAARAYDFWKTNTQRQAQLHDLERAYHENQVNRDWSEAQRISEQDWQEYLQKEMFRLQNNYNTPQRQVHRLLAAGVNPAAVFGQTGSATTPMTGAPSAPGTPSAPSAPGISSPASGGSPAFLSSAPYDSMIGTIFGGAAEVLDKLASAKQKGVDTSRMEAEIPLIIEEHKLNNHFLAVRNYLQDIFGSKEADLKVQNIVAGLDKILTEAKNLRSEGQILDEQQFQEKFKTLIYAEDLKKAITQNKMLGIELDHFEQKVVSIIKNLNSQTFVNYQQGDLAHQQALTEDQQRSVKTGLLDLKEKMLRRENYVQSQTFHKQADAVLAGFEREGLMNEQLANQIARGIKENDSFWINQLFDWMSKYSDSLWKGSMTFQNFVSPFLPKAAPAGSNIQTNVPWSFNRFMEESNFGIPK